MKFNHKKLLDRIREQFGTQGKFAKAAHMPDSAVSARLNGATEISRPDIISWVELLHIPISEIGVYFFTLASSEN